MRRFFPRKRRTADLIPQMKALGIDRVIDKVSDSLSALEQAKEEAWEAQASRSSAAARPVPNVVLVPPRPFRRVLRSFTLRRDETGEDTAGYRVLVDGHRLLEYLLSKGESSTLSVPINLAPNMAVVLETNSSAPVYVDSIIVDDLASSVDGYFGVTRGNPPLPMSAPIPSVYPNPIDVLRQQGILTRQEARVQRQQEEERRNSFPETDPVTTEEGRMKGLLNSWPKKPKRRKRR